MVDPGFLPGFIGWGVGKTLDQVINYVAQACNCFDHCQELQTLLLDIKPTVERAIQHSGGASSSRSPLPIGGAAAWLRELKPQLEIAEKELQKALNWMAERKERSAVPFDIIKRHKWSQTILKITEEIRKVAHDRAPFVNLESTLHTAKAVEDLTILFHRTFNVVRRSQSLEKQMKVAELRLTELVHTEICKIGGDEAIANQVKGVIEANIKREMQKINRKIKIWQEKAIQNPQESNSSREESITQDEPKVDGSTNFTVRFQHILSGRLTSDQQTVGQEEPGLMNDQQATSQEEYQVAKSTNLTMCLESTYESDAMEDLSTRQASVNGINTMQYMAPLVEYSLHDLKEATNNFAKENEVGCGGSSTVFKGRLKNGDMIAVKKFRADELDMYLNEMKIQGLCRHQNIVRLYGYAEPNRVQKLRHMFKAKPRKRDPALVYDYIEKGDLFYWLHRENGVLDWPTRFNIVLGVARGLVYLHYDAPHCIVHGDIKPGNICLDAEFCPKIADFGISSGANDIYISLVKGTLGYISPEYLSSGRLSLMLDVYSFGVVLLEIVSAERAFQVEGREDAFLSSWAIRLFKTGGVEEVVKELLDPKLMNEPALEVLIVVHVALLCVQEDPNNRPSMREVLSMLLGEMDMKPIPFADEAWGLAMSTFWT